MNTESCDMRPIGWPQGSIWDMEMGDFSIQANDAGQRFFRAMFPGENPCTLPLRPVVTPGLNGGQYWDWDGNEDKPTLMPSVNIVGSWHGWVRAGRMVSC